MKEPIDHRMYGSIESQNEFHSDQIRFLPTFIELVRNNFVYSKVDYAEIVEVEIRDGFLIKNRWVIRIIAIVTIIILFRFIQYGLYQSGGIREMSSAQWFNKGAIFSIWGPIILTIGALLALYQSLLKSTVITIKTPKISRRISIRKLDKNGETERLIPFLLSKDVLVFDNRK